MTDRNEIMMQFSKKFAELYREEGDASRAFLIGSFMNCFAMMESVDRAKTVYSVLQLLKDIGDTRFEDGHDFLSFMQDLTKKNIGEEP